MTWEELSEKMESILASRKAVDGLYATLGKQYYEGADQEELDATVNSIRALEEEAQAIVKELRKKFSILWRKYLILKMIATLSWRKFLPRWPAASVVPLWPRATVSAWNAAAVWVRAPLWKRLSSRSPKWWRNLLPPR